MCGVGTTTTRFLSVHNGLSLCISKDAVPEHLFEGDELGNCQNPRTRGNHGSSTILVRVYPNPASGTLTVQWNPRNDDESSLRIYDANGKIVMHKTFGGLSKDNWNVRHIKLDELAQGVYFLQMVGTDGVKTVQFVINR